MDKKCIFILGPESSGSRLMSRTLAHVLDIEDFDDWDGAGPKQNEYHKVWHESLPAGEVPQFADIDQMIKEHINDYALYFILTTRDITISESSRMARFAKPLEQVQQETRTALSIMRNLINSDRQTFIWSYESFMFLGKDYLNLLYRFLEIDSDFMPALIDGNRERLVNGKLSFRPSRFRRFFKNILH